MSTTAALASERKYDIQILATIAGSLSIAGCCVSLYWFVLMRRNFRRKLIMMLIVADLARSVSYVIFAAGALTPAVTPRGESPSNAFCQVTGFFTQACVSACDLAILFISMHTALQIFKPKGRLQSFLGDDGLYRRRHVVYALYIILPSFIASLAFVRGRDSGYVQAGAFCLLPVRPYWCRLALSWIPRYFIAAYIMWIAVRIYRQVGKDFKIFATQAEKTSSIEASHQAKQSIANICPGDFFTSKDASMNKVTVMVIPTDEDLAEPSPTKSLDQEWRGVNRKASVHWDTGFSFISTDPAGTGLSPDSRRGSQLLEVHDLPTDLPTELSTPSSRRNRLGSVATVCTLTSIGEASFDGMRTPQYLTPIEEANVGLDRDGPLRSLATSADLPVSQRRKAILVQLRLLFIYPVVYIIFWALPFVNHCFNYSNHWVTHPIFVLQALSTFCQCFMGFADCLVFLWRERPWKHIPGSDGTFIGSFCFWRFCGMPRRVSEGAISMALVEMNQEHTTSSAPVRPSLGSRKASGSGGSRRGVPMHKKTYSGTSDRAALEAERASERLAMERAANATLRPSLPRRSSLAPVSREWWERQDGVSEEDLALGVPRPAPTRRMSERDSTLITRPPPVRRLSDRDTGMI